MLEVRLLGGLAAAVDGRPVELPADARARELLARLALSPRPVNRSVLAGRLRPDVPEESARKTLRNALYELRRALGAEGAEALAVAGQDVGLVPGATRVDVWEFRRLRDAGDLEAAADAGRGELLAGVDGDWARAARDEHSAHLADVLARLALGCEEAGDPETALAWARRRLEIEPLGEAAHREVIRLQALGGDRAAALATARSLADRLRDELGLAPSAATRALVDAIRRGEWSASAAPLPAPPLPAGLAAASTPDGRGPVLARLDEAWAAARDGTRQFALITGEPGIGKTTLAAEVARRAHASGAVVLLGRSDEQALVPFQPWIEALETLLAALGPETAQRWLAAHDGALARLLPARAPVADPPGPRERYLAFELVRALFAETAAQLPVALVLDDIHWIDADSLGLLRHVARADPRVRILVVLCARASELGPAVGGVLADVRREGPLVHVDLVGLDEEAVAAVVARHGGTADADTVRGLRARSGGNPFFLTELLRGAGDGAPPAGVRDMIERRLGRLGSETRATLEVAAVAGTAFDLETVGASRGRRVEETLEALDGAQAAMLVAPADRPGRYAFGHALIADAIAAGLAPSQRARLHLALADASVSRGAPAGEVVRHLRGASGLADAARLVEWELAAAREAAAALAHAEAAGHCEAALAALPADAAAARGEVLLELGAARDRGGRREAARAAFAQAGDLARAGEDPGLLARAALGHGGTAVVIAAADPEAVSLLEDALAAVAPGDRATAARLNARLAAELYYDDRPRALELSARAVDLAGDDPAARAAALNARRIALWAPEHADERLEVADAMLAAAETAADRETQLQARNWRFVDLLELGRVADAAAEIDAYAELAQAVALPHFAWYVPLWRATLAMLEGRWERARELGREARAIGARADDPNAALVVEIQRANALYLQGRVADMDRERLVAGGAASPAAAEWLVNLALIDAELGDLEPARERVRELARDGAAAFAMDVNWHAACVLADAAIQVGDAESAAAIHAVLEPHARLFPLIARAVGCLGSCELYVGGLAGLMGRDDEALTRLRRAVSENDRAGARSPATLARVHLGEALLRGGEPAAARDVLQEAAAHAAELGLEGLAARAARTVV